jgi:hypothetical protein
VGFDLHTIAVRLECDPVLADRGPVAQDGKAQSPVGPRRRRGQKGAAGAAASPLRLRLAQVTVGFRCAASHIHGGTAHALDNCRRRFWRGYPSLAVKKVRRADRCIERAASRSVYFLLIVSRTVSFMLPTAF